VAKVFIIQVVHPFFKTPSTDALTTTRLYSWRWGQEVIIVYPMFYSALKRDLQHEKRNDECMSKRLFASLDPSISASPFGEVG
jgi:hypothetical protein